MSFDHVALITVSEVHSKCNTPRLTEGSFYHTNLGCCCLKTSKSTPVVHHKAGTNNVGPPIDSPSLE